MDSKALQYVKKLGPPSSAHLIICNHLCHEQQFS